MDLRFEIEVERKVKLQLARTTIEFGFKLRCGLKIDLQDEIQVELRFDLKFELEIDRRSRDEVRAKPPSQVRSQVGAFTSAPVTTLPTPSLTLVEVSFHSDKVCVSPW